MENSFKYIVGGTALSILGISLSVLHSQSGYESSDASGPQTSVNLAEPVKAERPKPNWIDQTPEQAMAKSAGCIECHEGVEKMHTSPSVVLG